MARHILHCDMNCFYAAVEMQRHPELRDKPLAVCGSQEERHGIVLTANYIAKPYGVKTGMAIWQARQKCPALVVIPPDMDEYIRFSRMAHEIYEDYTDQIEPFGLDENWLDVTGSVGLLVIQCTSQKRSVSGSSLNWASRQVLGYLTTRLRPNWEATIKSRMPLPILVKRTIKRLSTPSQWKICFMWGRLPLKTSCYRYQHDWPPGRVSG